MNINIVQISVPVMTPERFALLSGLDKRGHQNTAESGSLVTHGMIKNGHLPTVKLGKHRLINIVELITYQNDSNYSNVIEMMCSAMTAKNFGELTGLDQRGHKHKTPDDSLVVAGLIRNEHVPTVVIGKRKLINLVQLAANCSGDNSNNIVSINA